MKFRSIRSQWTLVFLLLLGATTNPADQAKIDDILDALQQRGQDLKEFSASVSQVEANDTMGTSATKTGKIWYQVKPDGSPRIRILFEKKAIEDKPAHDERREYLHVAGGGDLECGGIDLAAAVSRRCARGP